MPPRQGSSNPSGQAHCRVSRVEGLDLTVLGVVGQPGSGKTTLLVAVLPLLRAFGLSVSTIKHAHHGFELDRPGKDSHQHRLAGAREVLVSSSRRWALLHELDGPEAVLDD